MKNINVKILCKKCRIETRHIVEYIKMHRWEEYEVQGEDIHEILVCNGCDSITYRIRSTNSEEADYINDGKIIYNETINYYPARGYDLIEPIFEIWRTPLKVRKIYQETVDAFNNKQVILCSIGIRGIIEAICVEEGIQKNNLKEKIDELKKRGVINYDLCEGLHQSRIMGNDSAHKVEIFNKKELKVAMDLINTLIDNHYSLPEKVKELKKEVAKLKCTNK